MHFVSKTFVVKLQTFHFVGGKCHFLHWWHKISLNCRYIFCFQTAWHNIIIMASDEVLLKFALDFWIKILVKLMKIRVKNVLKWKII